MNDMQYQAVYNTLSFALASMMATTMYLWFRSTAVQDKFKSAVIISGLVHIPDCVPLPDAWHLRCQCCGVHPDRLLRFRYHFQVWCWSRDLPGHLCQVEQNGRLAWLRAGVICGFAFTGLATMPFCNFSASREDHLVTRSVKF